MGVAYCSGWVEHGWSGYGVEVWEGDALVSTVQGAYEGELAYRQGQYLAVLASLLQDGVTEVRVANEMIVRHINGSWPLKTVIYRPFWKAVMAHIAERVVEQATREEVASARRLAQRAVSGHVPGMPDLASLMQEAARPEQRGFELLSSDVQAFVQDWGWPVELYNPIRTRDVRRALSQDGDINSAKLLWAPHLVMVPPGWGPVFVWSTTSYVRNGTDAVRVIGWDTWEVIQECRQEDYPIFVAHRPYDGHQWRDLGWPEGSRISIAEVGTITTAAIEAPSGWDRVIALQDAKWESLHVWLQGMAS